MKKYTVFILCIYLFFDNICSAQSGNEKITENDAVKSHKPINIVISSDSLLKKIEHLHNVLDHINNTSEKGFKTRNIELELPKIKHHLEAIKTNITDRNDILQAKDLQLYKIVIIDMQEQLKEWRTSLFDYNRQIVLMNEEMANFGKDSSIRQIRTDTLFMRLYKNELEGIKSKWRKALSFTNANINKMTELQANVSNTYFMSIELESTIRKQIKQSSINTFNQDYHPLWTLESIKTNTEQQLKLKTDTKLLYKGQSKMIAYYFERNKTNFIGIGFIALIFFIWVFNTFRSINKTGQEETLENLKLYYLKKIPIAASLVIALNIAAFFDLNPPSIYINMMQFFLLIAISFVLWKAWNKNTFKYWIAIIALYLFFTFSSVITDISIVFRYTLVIINILAILLGISLFKLFKKELVMKGFVTTVTFIFIILNIISIIFNITGRVNLTKIVSMSAIFSMSHAIGLSVFIYLITEAFHLQILRSRLKDGKTTKFAYHKIESKLNRLLTIVAVISWIIIFTSNLNIYGPLYHIINHTLNKHIEIGDFTFNVKHAILFFIILYVSNLLQKYLGYFMGETEDDFSSNMKKNSRLAIVRLILLLLGFLLAITASGLPVDKITVVLGALSVGVGLGLQNIVNNLVSGFILIFEKPLQVGDFIELADKKGRVKNMGIRSSRIVTQDGAEIIVPNGDLLSNRLTNWTLSNDHIRSILVCTLQPSHKLDLAKTCIMEVLNEMPDILQKQSKDILVTNINDTTIELRIQFWVSNIDKELELKSEFLLKIYKKLKENNIIII